MVGVLSSLSSRLPDSPRCPPRRSTLEFTPLANSTCSCSASHDILRLYDRQDTAAFKHSTVPFLIIPGPPRAGVISHLYVDPTSRFMISTAGTRGWEGSNTEVLIGYEIGVAP